MIKICAETVILYFCLLWSRQQIIFPSLSLSGGLYVRPRRRGQHVGKPTDRLSVQSVAGGSQSAGNDLGETAENISSFNAAVHPAAAQPRTHSLINPEAQIDRTPGLNKLKQH